MLWGMASTCYVAPRPGPWGGDMLALRTFCNCANCLVRADSCWSLIDIVAHNHLQYIQSNPSLITISSEEMNYMNGSKARSANL